MMASGCVLLARPSWYHRRYALLRQQLEAGQIGELVAVRLIRLMPEDSWLPDGVTLNYGFDAFDAVCSLLGDVKRVMAREQCLKLVFRMYQVLDGFTKMPFSVCLGECTG